MYPKLVQQINLIAGKRNDWMNPGQPNGQKENDFEVLRP
jgi:hypothetical protein